ncbi:MFS transporter [Spelaeicoccus albus]|uniref:MFS family permease n=1 Tax=Spelaeicoccus albus TaxID=1280376 RepID=A0A7Z0A9S4_9MICO|nr:MFS transporter [Spelaeicoccus albus]NYI66198.1 MFS family permease [Spelaeicoccus albus]
MRKLTDERNALTTHRVQRRTLTVLAVSQVVGTVGVGIAPSIGVLLAGQVTHSEAWAGLARTASTLGAAIFGLPLGALAQRFGRRSALSVGWWTAALGSIVLVAAAQWSLVVPLFGGLLLIGAGSAVSLQSRFAATDMAQPHHKARALALVVWIGTIGNVLGPNLGVPGELVHAATGLTVFAAAFLIAGICLALAGCLIFGLLRPDPLLELHKAASAPTANIPASENSAIGRRRGSGMRIVFSELSGNRPAALALVAILTAQVVMVSMMTMAPVHVTDIGGSVTIVGMTISLHIAGMYGLSPVVGVMADRLGHKLTMGVGLVIFLTSLVSGILFAHDRMWIAVSLILLGLGWSFVNVTGSALFSGVISAQSRASAQGSSDAMANLLGATAAFIAGPLLAATNYTILSLCAIVVMVPLAILLLITRTARSARCAV